MLDSHRNMWLKLSLFAEYTSAFVYMYISVNCALVSFI